MKNIISVVLFVVVGAARAESGVGAAAATVAGLCGLYCCSESCALINQGEGALVERLGRFHRELGPGLHAKMPVIERISARMSMRERVLDVPPQSCITADNAPLRADAVIFYRVTDLVKAVYAIDDFGSGLQDVILTQLRSEIGQMTLDSTFAAREKLNSILLREANAVTQAWGIRVLRVEVRDIMPSPEILTAMELQMAAERQKRAAILKSEGERQATINAAEAEKDGVVLAAQGEQSRLEAEASGLATAIDTLSRALDGANATKERRAAAAELLLERARIRASLALAQSPNAKIVAMHPETNAAAHLGTTLGLSASMSSSSTSANENLGRRRGQ